MTAKLTGIVFLTVLFLLALCGVPRAEEQSPVSQNWGIAVEAVKKAQIANPDAGNTPKPVKSFDGQAAQAALEGYHESFKSEQGTQNYSINLGDISNIGKK